MEKMTHKEYTECLACELYGNKQTNAYNRIRIKYFQPNTNCIYLARKMWYYHAKGGIWRVMAKFIYLKISHKYGCIIYPTAQVGKGFHITHPVGIVIGDCHVGENFMIYQNCTVGTRKYRDQPPEIGNNVMLCSNSLILGNISIADHVVIGASSLVIHEITEPGLYVGNPLRKVK